MSLFSNLLSEGCVNFEKCGDVVVSPKDNILGMFCNFCCDIFTNLVEFLHHLQWAHSDVLCFTREHNVYTVNELMSLPGDLEEKQPEANLNRDEQINDMELDADALIAQILKRQPEHEKKMKPLKFYKQRIKEEVQEASSFKSKGTFDHANKVKEQLKSLIGIKDEKQTKTLHGVENLMDTNKKTEVVKNLLVPLKTSGNINATTKVPMNENNINNLVTPVSRNKPIVCKHLAMPSEKRMKRSLNMTDNAVKVEIDHSTKPTNKSSAPILINKIEYLPSIDLNLLKTSMSTTKETSTLETELKKPLDPSSFSNVSNPLIETETQNTEPSFLETELNQIDIESERAEAQSNKRQLYKLASSIEEIKMSIILDDNCKRKIPNGGVKYSLFDAPQTDMNKTHLEFGDVKLKQQQFKSAKIKLRDDFVLLQFVGLPIIKDVNYEDRKPVEFCEALRFKAVKFSKMLKYHDIIWSLKKSTQVESKQKIADELSALTAQTNKFLKADLNTNELKRILNLISMWYTQQTTEKLFKKAELSSTIEAYLLMFGFLPKLNRCVYYCEWCDECSSNKSRYIKHRSSHQLTVQRRIHKIRSS